MKLINVLLYILAYVPVFLVFLVWQAFKVIIVITLLLGLAVFVLLALFVAVPATATHRFLKV
jgi:hypothetical protein